VLSSPPPDLFPFSQSLEVHFPMHFSGSLFSPGQSPALLKHPLFSDGSLFFNKAPSFFFLKSPGVFFFPQFAPILRSAFPSPPSEADFMFSKEGQLCRSIFVPAWRTSKATPPHLVKRLEAGHFLLELPFPSLRHDLAVQCSSALFSCDFSVVFPPGACPVFFRRSNPVVSVLFLQRNISVNRPSFFHLPGPIPDSYPIGLQIEGPLSGVESRGILACLGIGQCRVFAPRPICNAFCITLSHFAGRTPGRPFFPFASSFRCPVALFYCSFRLVGPVEADLLSLSFL